MSLGWPVVLLLLAIPLGLVLVQRFRKKARHPQFVAEVAMLDSLAGYKQAQRRNTRLKRIETGLLCMMIIGFVLLVARPQIGLTNYSDEHSRDIVLCLDVSGSMEAYIPPALNALESIYRNNPSDRYSIVVFAGRGFTVLPLTRDPVAIQEKIELLREVYEHGNDSNYRFRSLPGYGTDVGEGVLTAVQRFDNLETHKSRNIILVSDLDQTGGDFDRDNKNYLDKISLVPQNRINMFILQTPLEYLFATSPQRIIATSGAQVYKIDETNAEESATQLLPHIFSQALNTTTVVSKNQADYPYYILMAVGIIAAAWTVVVALRWRYT